MGGTNELTMQCVCGHLYIDSVQGRISHSKKYHRATEPEEKKAD